MSFQAATQPETDAARSRRLEDEHFAQVFNSETHPWGRKLQRSKAAVDALNERWFAKVAQAAADGRVVFIDMRDDA